MRKHVSTREKSMGYRERIILPRISEALERAQYRLIGQKNHLSFENIEKIIRQCGTKLPEPYRTQFVSFYALILQKDLMKIGSMKRVCEEKKYVMYYRAGKTELNDSEYESQCLVDKRKNTIWLDAIKKVVYIKGHKAKIDPLHWRLLIYLIKKKGKIATYQELYEHFCKWAKDRNVYYEWNKSLRGTVYRWFTDIQEKIKKNRNLCMDERDAFRDFIINVPNEGYRIDTELEKCEYCLIEAKHIELHH